MAVISPPMSGSTARSCIGPCPPTMNITSKLAGSTVPRGLLLSSTAFFAAMYALCDSTAAASFPLKGSARLSGSTTGVRPCGVAIVTFSPASENVLCGRVNSSAQNPVGWGVPSFIVQTVDPVNTIKTELISTYLLVTLRVPASARVSRLKTPLRPDPGGGPAIRPTDADLHQPRCAPISSPRRPAPDRTRQSG